MDRLYKVDESSFEHGKLAYGMIKCFTDGSRIDERSGAGYCIMADDKIIAEKAIPLGSQPTVFQAEVVAIQQAAVKLRELRLTGDVVIYCDSQAALKALNNPILKAQTVMITALELDKLALRQEVKLHWIKAHVGTRGNERADVLAKEGSKSTVEEDLLDIPPPSCQIRRDIRERVDKRWHSRWLLLTYARQSKLFWPSPNRVRSKHLLKLPRRDYGRIVQLFTGFNYFNYHSWKLKESASQFCRLCDEQEIEDTEHLLCSCPRLWSERSSAVGTVLQVESSRICLMPVWDVLRYLNVITDRLGLAR
jgi:ribonuclease HI